jgi:hypothetical protein
MMMMMILFVGIALRRHVVACRIMCAGERSGL